MFKEYYSDRCPKGWTVVEIAEAAKIHNNLRKPINVCERSNMLGRYPYYGPTGILEFIDEYRVSGLHVLIGEDGDHFLKYSDQPMTLLVDGKFNVNNHAHILVGQKGCSTEWVFHFFRHQELTPHLTRQGVGRYKLSKSSLLKIALLVPPLEEQFEIIAILSTWDTAIETTQKLIEAKKILKKGLMQQLLTGKRRFPEFGKPSRKSGELPEGWKQVELGKHFEEVTETVGRRTVVPYSITAGTGFVSQQEKWGKDISGSQYANYTLLRKGQFSYNKGNSKKYPCGCTYLLHQEETIAVPNVFISFEKKTDEVYPEFYEHYFLVDYCANELRRFITSGARADGLLNLNKHDFFSIRIPLPRYQEQYRIAEILSACDREILLLSEKTEQLQKQKKGLMQKLLTGQVRVRG